MDAVKALATANAAAAANARTPVESNYVEVSGPHEMTGGHGSAWVTQSPSGVLYLEYRPVSGGRVKRVPLTAVSAVFPSILPEEKTETPAKK